MRAAEALKRAEEALAQMGISAPRLESEILTAHAMGIKQENLFLHLQEEISQEAFENLLQRRLRGEPIAYITGLKDFFGREFEITPDVLIPRPETETLVEVILKNTPHPSGVWADIGTGSGIIAITLALEKGGWQWIATDVSVSALRLAKRNAQRFSASVNFVKGDCLTIFQKCSLSGIVSNPPYVSPQDEHLDPHVREWEPHVALFAPNGTSFIQNLIKTAPHVLKPGGVLCFEFGMGQAQRVEELLREHYQFQIIPDMSGIPRVAFANLR
ncbi:MAG: peptide chain release factor N(5)-glutamine methyltransferase, partial [Candidatus Caldarchaeum sp.]